MEINEVDAVAKVIVNSRPGSIAINQRVSLKPSAVSHGNLSVSIQSTPIVSQPNPFAAGETVTTSFDEITIKESGGELIKISGTNSLNDVVRGLNKLGACPSDLISILQALKLGDASLVAMLSSVSPVLVLPLLWLVYKRRPAAGAWLGAALTVGGTVLILMH